MNFQKNAIKLALVGLCSLATVIIVGCSDSDSSDSENKPTVVEQDPVKKVLVIGIDGLMYDYIDEIDNADLNEPALAHFPRMTISKAVTGGFLGTQSHQVSSSGPAWSSILTGNWVDGHDIASNNNQPAVTKTLFEHLYAEDNTIDMASYAAWSPINSGHAKQGMPYVKQRVDGDQRPENTSVDAFITDKLVTELTDPDSNLDFIFTHLDEIDGAGHTCGWCEAYEQTLKQTDEYLGLILDAIEYREANYEEEWLVLFVSDHGHLAQGGHGGDSIHERTSVIGTNKPELMNDLFGSNATEINLAEEDQNRLMGYPGITAITPTVLNYLGYEIQPAQLFSSPSLIGEFALKQAYIQIEQQSSDEASISINWRATAEAESVSIYRDGEKIAELNAADQHYVDKVSVATLGEGDKHIAYTITPNNGNSLTTWANFSLGDKVSISSILKKVAHHSSFNETVTPFEFIAANEEAVEYEQGPFTSNSAVKVNRDKGYLSTALPIGDSLQGSVGFWLKVNSDVTSDPNVIANKDWQSGFNPGFTISITNSTMKFNVGDGEARADVSLPYVKNLWMFVIASYDLVNGQISLYLNDDTLGFQQASVAANVKSIGSDFPVNIAEGGDGNYNLNTNIDISVADLLLFSHALANNEARSLANIDMPVEL